MGKDSFVLYTEIWDTVSLMTNEEAGRLFKMILNYESGLDLMEGIEDPSYEGEAFIAFSFIRRQLVKNDAKYQETINARSEAGKKGAAKRWQTMANDSNAIAKDGKAITNDNSGMASDSKHMAKIAVNDNEHVNVNEEQKDLKEKTNKRERFAPPTLDEVRTYCQERHNSVDPEQFINFYTSKGWMVGKNPMKDWRAAVRTWERQNHSSGRRTPSPMNNSDYLDEILLREIHGGDYEQTGNF